MSFLPAGGALLTRSILAGQGERLGSHQFIHYKLYKLYPTECGDQEMHPHIIPIQPSRNTKQVGIRYSCIVNGLPDCAGAAMICRQ
jgi:hypothetical protein